MQESWKLYSESVIYMQGGSGYMNRNSCVSRVNRFTVFSSCNSTLTQVAEKHSDMKYQREMTVIVLVNQTEAHSPANILVRHFFDRLIHNFATPNDLILKCSIRSIVGIFVLCVLR